MESHTPKKLFAEALGTFCLVLAGTGACAIDDATKGGVTHVGIALSFGLVVMAMVYAIGEVSGAHINCAVTTGFAVAGRMSWAEVPGYWVAQIAGAFAASGLLRTLFPGDATLGATLPTGSAWQSLVLEIAITFMLVFVILAVTRGAKEKGLTAGIAIGGTLGLGAMWAGPISGASMNPARSIGPAVVSGHTEFLWVYIVGPIAGAILAAVCSTILKPHVADK